MCVFYLSLVYVANLKRMISLSSSSLAHPVKCIVRCGSDKRRVAAAAAVAPAAVAAAAAALSLSVEHWSSPRGDCFGDRILGRARLRHHPHGILEGLPLVAEPDPNDLAVVAELLRQGCNLITCEGELWTLISRRMSH